MQLRYAFRLDPGPGQRVALARAFGCARVVYNDAVAARERARREGAAFPSAGALSRTLITEAKRSPGRQWLSEVSAVILQQALRDVERAYTNYFSSLKGSRQGARVGAPRFKSKRDARQAIRFTANARWKINEAGRLLLPKIGEVKVRWSRTLPSVPSSVTVIRDAAGRYFASFVIETDPDADLARMPEADNLPSVGIDLGLTQKKAQRELSRKQKGSKNREKARLRVARAHAQVADARREFHHQLSTQLIRESQAVAVEDLAVTALARTRLGKSVHDAGWAQFLAMLEYKAQRYARVFVKVGRFEPTSQVCSVCGVKDGPKPLHVRTWTCTHCGTVHDRDHNAAKNVKQAAGLAVTACRAQVRPELVPAQREEAGSHGIHTGTRAAQRHSTR
ncbi:RNA-guided endonuclease InsQ/TnpB family protein [Streptomyces mirabilis]|uniref:RNA-guided endonuclease InsQ/TnpB family protein n=1 Tax=Streptomyces mirabilis TaxID=68239 RepID=UPI0036DE910C